MTLVADGTRRCLEGGRRAVEVEAWISPGGCLAFVAVGGVVAVVVALSSSIKHRDLYTKPQSSIKHRDFYITNNYSIYTAPSPIHTQPFKALRPAHTIADTNTTPASYKSRRTYQRTHC